MFIAGVELTQHVKAMNRDIDSVLKDYLAPIPLLLQRAQMRQLLLYQEAMIAINQVEEPDNESTSLLYSNIRENISKKVKFGTIILVAKTCVQVAIEENVIPELTGLIEFIIKYRRSTELNIEKVHSLGNEIQEPLSISNPEYHKPRGCPPNHLKSSTEKNSVQQVSSSSKTCRYCLEKGHNVRGYKQYKLDLFKKENN
ncbi:39025_t:CDS:2 [Gigaspora margarita]|uniref:39025_t:CDS:1 n=1 Tax=Gigaspora margarita TaxID=4874 RepID=A0ABN7V7P5_GIGMA|nr:39025_t:CDS:2 [Gigaspora margarita]